MSANTTCPSCSNTQFSITDQKYAELFGHCWREDCDAWRRGDLAIEEFERREQLAAAEAAKAWQ